MKRLAIVAMAALSVVVTGCELTATAYVEQRWTNDPHMK